MSSVLNLTASFKNVPGDHDQLWADYTSSVCLWEYYSSIRMVSAALSLSVVQIVQVKRFQLCVFHDAGGFPVCTDA